MIEDIDWVAVNDAVLLGLGVVLALVAVGNYATAGYGAAVAAGVGAIVTLSFFFVTGR
jgi:uncharacterized membrane protein YkgB